LNETNGESLGLTLAVLNANGLFLRLKPPFGYLTAFSLIGDKVGVGLLSISGDPVL